MLKYESLLVAVCSWSTGAAGQDLLIYWLLQWTQYAWFFINCFCQGCSAITSYFLLGFCTNHAPSRPQSGQHRLKRNTSLKLCVGSRRLYSKGTGCGVTCIRATCTWGQARGGKLALPLCSWDDLCDGTGVQHIRQLLDLLLECRRD